MSEVTEKRQRSLEELVTTEDYLSEIALIMDLGSQLQGATEVIVSILEDTIKLLVKGIKEKEKYKMKVSKRWRRKQGLFSKIRDTLIERQETKRLKQELKKEKLIKELESYRNKIEADEDSQSEEIQDADCNSSSLVVKSSTDVSVEDNGSETEVLEF